MDSSIPGIPNSPLSTTAVFADNVQDWLGTGALHVHPSATIVVNSIDDAVVSIPGVTTLRDAINKANADSGEDLIVFDRSLFSSAQTITLKLGELDITHSLDIIAPRDSLTGGDLVTVSGNNASRVFEIEKGATVTLSGLIVADGRATGNNGGGGINNSGTLTLDNSIVRGNVAQKRLTFPIEGGKGAGIYSNANLTVNNSTISGNSTRDNFGGGIYNDGGTSTVNNSTVSGNLTNGLGGGIFNLNGTSTVNNSTISGNSAGGHGGGISNVGTSTVNNSTISDNSAGGSGGGIYNDGDTSTVNNSTISGNRASRSGGGGGIADLNVAGTSTVVNNSTISGNSAVGDGGGIFGTITVNNSTISGNSARGDGGGIYSSSSNPRRNSTVVNNSTISGNSAVGDGGGISNSRINHTSTVVNNSTISGNSAGGLGGGIYKTYSGTLTLLFSTVTQNQAANGGGVYQSDVPRLSSDLRGSNNVRNTIIAANLNTLDGVNPDVSGTFTSNGYNLIGDGTGSTGFDETICDIVGTSDWVIDPRLDVLAFNGGPTQTIALLLDSPAIGAADPIVLDTDPTTDQRGLPRRAADGSADIGAFQFS